MSCFGKTRMYKDLPIVKNFAMDLKQIYFLNKSRKIIYDKILSKKVLTMVLEHLPITISLLAVKEANS